MTVKVLKQMAFKELLSELQDMGMDIGQEKLKKLIKDGYFPFATAVQMAQTEYLIWRKGFSEWVSENAVEEETI